jgi:hypothetical protein
MGTGICSGIDKAVVPWSAIIQSQDDFVARKYLPSDVDLKEPSKLQNWDMTALLNFWYAQQESGDGPTFLFKAWRNKDGDMVASVVSDKSPSHRTSKVKKCSRVMIRRPWDSPTESENDAVNDTSLEEDDAHVDSADGRSPQKRLRRTVGPLSAREGTAAPCSIPKPRPVKTTKSGALLTSRMGNLLAGLTGGDTGGVDDDVAMEGRNMLPALKSNRGKKDVIEAPARTTQSKSTQKPSDSTTRVTRARGRR